MWRRTVHDATGYFDERYLALGDQDFWLRLGRSHKLVHINEVTGLVWMTPDALSVKPQSATECFEIQRKHQKAMLLSNAIQFTPEMADLARRQYIGTLQRLIDANELTLARTFHAQNGAEVLPSDEARKISDILAGAAVGGGQQRGTPSGQRPKPANTAAPQSSGAGFVSEQATALMERVSTLVEQGKTATALELYSRYGSVLPKGNPEVDAFGRHMERLRTRPASEPAATNAAPDSTESFIEDIVKLVQDGATEQALKLFDGKRASFSNYDERLEKLDTVIGMLRPGN